MLTFFKINFFKKLFHRNTIRVSNGLDPDQDRRFVGPDLDPYCLQRLSADDKVAASKERAMKLYFLDQQLFHDLKIITMSHAIL